MKFNIFLIPLANMGRLREKIKAVGMESIYHNQIDEWSAEFYFSTTPDPIEIPWAKDFASELAALSEVPRNEMYYGTYLWWSDEICFAISFGKSHFYLREFCDSDFGLSMAKRIGDKDDVRPKSCTPVRRTKHQADQVIQKRKRPRYRER